MMLKSIQVQRSYRVDRINEDGPIGFGKKNSGNVSVLLKTGEFRDVPFGGFIEVSNISGLPSLKIYQVFALCDDDEAQNIDYKIPRNHYVVGTYLNGRALIQLFKGQPKHFIDNSTDDDYKNNVYSL